MTMIYCMVACMLTFVISLFMMSDSGWMFIVYRETRYLRKMLFMLMIAIVSVIGFGKCYIELFGI